MVAVVQTPAEQFVRVSAFSTLMVRRHIVSSPQRCYNVQSAPQSVVYGQFGGGVEFR